MVKVSDPLSFSHDRSKMQLLIDLRLSYAVVASGLILLGFFWNKLEGFGWSYLALIVSSFFANVFTFIVNDYYDAADDANDPEKHARNFFCSPHTRSLGNVVLYLSLGLSLIFGVLAFSPPVFMIILGFLILAFFYSAPPIKLRDRAYWDWIFVFLWKGSVIAAGYVYFFGLDLPNGNYFIYGTLMIIMVFSLISQMDNQIRDFIVDKTNNTGHSVQRLGHKSAVLLKKILLTFLFGFSLLFCYFNDLYITMALILLNISLYYFASPRKYGHVLDFANLWFIVLFLEHFMSHFSYRQQILFAVWIVVMISLALLHVKRTNLFDDTSTKFGT